MASERGRIRAAIEHCKESLPAEVFDREEKRGEAFGRGFLRAVEPSLLGIGIALAIDCASGLTLAEKQRIISNTIADAFMAIDRAIQLDALRQDDTP